MKVRKPLADYSRSLPHWCPAEPEFSQINNAASTTLPHLEPYLIKVLRQARDELNPADDDNLLREMDLFIRQEANHYKQHQLYNDTLYENGYPGLRKFEQQLATDYENFLRDRTLKFNIAYSEGFESLGIIQAEWIFNHAQRWLRDADPEVRTLWEWHLAEEYEHRRVCYDLYKRLYGGYWYRIYGYFYAMWHLNGYGLRVSRFLIQQDRQDGKVGNRPGSWWREKRYRVAFNTFAFFKMWRVLSPFYNPARLTMPWAAEQRLETVITAD